MRSEISDRLHHSCLERGVGVPLSEARLTDRSKIAIVLQACSLASHLDSIGCDESLDWRDASVDRWAVLRGLKFRSGKRRSTHQAWLIDLLKQLFRTDAGIAGRGQARRVARILMWRWRFFPTPMRGDRAVSAVLDSASFLWEPSFARPRTTLVACHQEGQRSKLILAGEGEFRRAVLD